ncbi:MAG: L,D-transpeptidase family protein [Bacteroidota bacterium]
MKISFLLFCLFLFGGCTCQRIYSGEAQIKHTRQLIVVTSKNEAATTAQLHSFQRKMNGWQPVFPAFDVTLGRTGLAWGRGLHEEMQGKQKQEGDGKSPAGIFTFGKAFGYAPPGEMSIKLPYVQADEHLECVDDAQSVYYNLLVDNRLFTKDWGSSEFMRLKDDQYKWGIFVEHNTPAARGAGSCIFFHIWKKTGAATSGCTAMSEENLLKLLGWLDPAALPLLVQATEKDYAILRERHGFPALPKP